VQSGTPGSVTSGGGWAERFVLAMPTMQGSALEPLTIEQSVPSHTNSAASLPSAMLLPPGCMQVNSTLPF